MESCHWYSFHVMLLSSHIGGALLRVHITPTRPDLAANPNLCFASRPFLSRARDPGHKQTGKRTRQAADEAEAVGEYLNHGIPALVAAGELHRSDASSQLQAVQNEEEASASASLAAAYGGGGGMWSLWPTTGVEPAVRPPHEKAVVAVHANVALERASGKAPKGSASCPPTDEARSWDKQAVQQAEQARPSTLSVLAEAAGVTQQETVRYDAAADGTLRF